MPLSYSWSPSFSLFRDHTHRALLLLNRIGRFPLLLRVFLNVCWIVSNTFSAFIHKTMILFFFGVVDNSQFLIVELACLLRINTSWSLSVHYFIQRYNVDLIWWNSTEKISNYAYERYWFILFPHNVFFFWLDISTRPTLHKKLSNKSFIFWKILERNYLI